MEYDAIVIGAGHNGLVAANYLARKGMKVGVFERRSVVGGCCTTEAPFSKARDFMVNAGAIDHILIHGTSIIRDLELEKYGLKYVRLEPMFEVPFEEGRNVVFYSDLKKTVGVFEQFSKRDAQRYETLVREWLREEELLRSLMLDAPPRISELFGVNIRSLGRFLSRSSLLGAIPAATHVDFDSMIRTVVVPANQLLKEEFEDEHIRVALSALFSLIFSTMSPSLPSSGLMVIMHTMLYKTGLHRPVGGSGMLPLALVKALESLGGSVFTNSEVRRIVVKGMSVMGVELSSGEFIGARVVVSNVDAKRTLTKLVEPDLISSELKRKLENLRITSYGMTFHAALNSLPKMNKDAALLQAGKLIVPDTIEAIESAYYIANSTHRLSPIPLLAVNFPTTYDPSLAPLDRHVLYSWAQFVPDNSPMIWEEGYSEFREDAEAKIKRRLFERWPDLERMIVDTFTETPGDLEQRLWIQRGNTQHIDPTLDQLYYYRPTPELSQYKSPIKGLYLTGAATHPGGGISGMPGHNTAKVILRDVANI